MLDLKNALLPVANVFKHRNYYSLGPLSMEVCHTTIIILSALGLIYVKAMLPNNRLQLHTSRP